MREIKTAFRLFEERGKYEQTGKKVSYKTVFWRVKNMHGLVC